MQRMSPFTIALAALLVIGSDAVAGDEKPRKTEPSSRRILRIAADPSNLPFSNRAQEGFENELATLLAQELKAEVEYEWRSQRRGFLRETLGQNRCDLVLGIPSQTTECLTTKPYYRSTYVWLSRRQDWDGPATLRMVEQSQSRIGVQLLGDGAISPPAYTLVDRGLSDRLSAYSLYADRSSEMPAIISAVKSGEVEIALAWGPQVGSFVRKPGSELQLTPLRQEEFAAYPVQFEISLGVRRGDGGLRDELDQILFQKRPEVEALLDRYGVPRAGHSPKLEQKR